LKLIEKPKYINIAGKLLDLSIPKIMGVINITPDSFYEGSRVTEDREILKTAGRMLEEGADIIDIGGYSSRPGAGDVTREEEKKRVLKAITLVNREFPDAIISVDTFRAEIAREAVNECGAHMVNDISGGEADKGMSDVIRELNVPYIMMHMQGMPGNMQDNPVYTDVVSDILVWFSRKIVGLQSAGVKDIIIDPGFGFGKTTGHNFEILHRLGDFAICGLPLLVGMSRKSMIWKTLDVTPEEALNGTTVLNTIALMKGADILRVHDVKEAIQAVRLMEMIKNTKMQVEFQDRN
jgi:dihydropteroate synthase